MFFSLIGEEEGRPRSDSYLVDSASSHMPVSYTHLTLPTIYSV